MGPASPEQASKHARPKTQVVPTPAALAHIEQKQKRAASAHLLVKRPLPKFHMLQKPVGVYTFSTNVGHVGLICLCSSSGGDFVVGDRSLELRMPSTSSLLLSHDLSF